MELLVFEPEAFGRLYNCDNFTVDQMPIGKRQHFWHGIILIGLFLLFEVLYIPCMISLYWHLENACYKMLFYMGVVDMLIMLMNGLETGLLGIYGAVYCTAPMFIYLTGLLGLVLWFAETGCELLLAINRCLEFIWPNLANTIFKGNRTWYLCVLPTLYAICAAVVVEPILFSGLYFSWFFNPYVGYKDDFGQIYHSQWHTFHDSFVMFGLTTIYITFSGILIYRTQTMQSDLVRTSFGQKMVFLQVVIISFFNAACSGIYIYMQLTRISEWLIIAGTYTWVFKLIMSFIKVIITAICPWIPPIVYLGLNRTIRTDCLKMAHQLLVNVGMKKPTNNSSVCPLPPAFKIDPAPPIGVEQQK